MIVQLYEWLKGDGNAYIDTLYSLHVGNEFKITLKDVWIDGVRQYVNHENKGWGQGGAINISGGCRTRLDMNDYNNYRIYYQGVSDFLLYPIKDEPYTEKITISEENIVANVYDEKGDTIADATTKFNGIGANTLYLYRDNHTPQVTYPGVKLISNVVISENGSEVLHLRPCKLLTPYGNHQAGECAMIDVLSNTLYFNQGSGAFSVEGEAGEIIDTTPVINNIISPLSTKAVRLRESMNIKVFNSPSSNSILEIDNVNSISFKFEIGKFGTWLNTRIAEIGNKAIDCYDNGIYIYQAGSQSMYLTDISNHDFFLDKSGIVIDGVKFDLVSDNINFKIRASEGSSCNMRIYDVDLGTIHLHPAELALPYENHPIGTACMIDINSGDLYFNQGSGSFSCEGAFLGYWQDKPMTDHYCDVEGTLHRSVQIFADNGERLRLIWEKNLPFTTHRWLKGDVGTKINIAEYKTISAKVRLFQNSGSTLAGFGGNSLWSASHDNHSLAIQNGSGISWFDYNKCTAIIFPTTEYSIDYDAKLIVCNGFYLTIPINNRPIDLQVVDGLRAITIDGHTFTPAILDRPTLPTEDNNGIARKQGEAVFVDEERYRRGLPWCFGNVASSGSFSVSDYLIEGEDYERIEGVVGICESTSRRYINVNIDLSDDIPVSITGYVFKGWYNGGRHMAILEDASSIEYCDSRINIYEVADKDRAAVLTFEGLFSADFYKTKLTCNGQESDYHTTHTQIKSILATFWHELVSGKKVIMTAFKKQGVIDLVPVRLLRNIEPYCTHNGKGGKVGEIGFFDTISGKFYGNDGSGEFTEYIP